MRASRVHPARLTLAFAAALVGALILHYSGLWPHWPKPAEHIYEAVELIAAACCLWRAYAYPRERKAWLAIGLGMVSFATAELYYTIVLEPRGDDIPYPSLADALYLGLYPCCFVGLLLLARCRAGRLPWMLWVDGLIVAFGFAAVASALVYGRVLDSTGGDPLTVATNLAYPMSDVLLLGLVAGLIGVFGLRGWRAWSAVICGFTLLGVADTIYLWRVASDSYEVGGVLDAAWPAGMVLVGAAAWQQPGRLDARAVADRGFLPVPLIAGLSATALLVLDHYHRLDQTAVWAAAACVLAVVVRLGGTFRAHGRMLRASRHEAAHDALTGLGNRRSLIAELERRLAQDEPEPTVLALFDLDGFKAYNDAFGHPAGDLLLQRLGARLAERAAATPRSGWAATSSASWSPAARQRRSRRPRPARALATPARASRSAPPRARSTSRARRAPCPTRCRSPTAACTRTSAAAARRRATSPRTSCCARCTSAAPTSASTAARSPSSPSRPLAALGLEADEVAPSASAPSCMTSARSPCRTRSSPSPARSTTTSGSSCAATR